jgi:hypothetical protein
VTRELRERLSARRDELIRLLRRPEDSGNSENRLNLDDGDIVEARQDWIAVRLWSRLLNRELWLARDDRTAEELSAEFPGVPILTLAEVPALKGKPKELLRAILDAKSEFPDARLEQ